MAAAAIPVWQIVLAAVGSAAGAYAAHEQPFATPGSASTGEGDIYNVGGQNVGNASNTNADDLASGSYWVDTGIANQGQVGPNEETFNYGGDEYSYGFTQFTGGDTNIQDNYWTLDQIYDVMLNAENSYTPEPYRSAPLLVSETPYATEDAQKRRVDTTGMTSFNMLPYGVQGIKAGQQGGWSDSPTPGQAPSKPNEGAVAMEQLMKLLGGKG